MNLTKTQKTALNLIEENSVTYTTDGKVPSSPGGKIVQRRISKQLKDLGLIQSFNVHPWGSWPIYGLMLTEKGKEVYNQLKG